MARKKPKKATLRYFTRFKEGFGYLRAVVRHDTTRKYIVTPLVISQEQATRLDTTGHIHPITCHKDAITDGWLREYTKCIWQTVRPLIESGEFASMSSKELAAAVFGTAQDEESRRRDRLKEATERNFQRQAEEAAGRGHELRRLTVEEFVKLTNELKERLTPEEYAALWEHPGKKGGKDGSKD